MKPYQQIYLNFFGYNSYDFIESELSRNVKAKDIHHIDCKGMGGSKEKDFIENLIALTNDEHVMYGDKKQFKVFLYVKHILYIQEKRPDYKIQWERIDGQYRYDVFKELRRINK